MKFIPTSDLERHQIKMHNWASKEITIKCDGDDNDDLDFKSQLPCDDKGGGPMFSSSIFNIQSENKSLTYFQQVGTNTFS